MRKEACVLFALEISTSMDFQNRYMRSALVRFFVLLLFLFRWRNCLERSESPVLFVHNFFFLPKAKSLELGIGLYSYLT